MPDSCDYRPIARGVITNYSYDTLNRLIQVSYNVGSTGVPATATVGFTYGTNANQNNNGRLLTMTDGTGSEAYEYDPQMHWAKKVTKTIDGTPYVIQYAYNLAGELTSITYPSGPSGRVVQQSYDVIGRLAAITSGTANYASAFAYNLAGQVTGFNYGNGVAASFTYSPERLALATLRYSKGATELLNLTYGYSQNGGNNGQITSITDNVDPTRSMTYSYDPLARLKVAYAGPEANPTWKLDWDYDRYGNRLNQNVRAGSPPGPQLAVDPATNRVTGTGYGYDANGNMTQDGLNSLTYDGENRVVSSSGSTYSYDGNGLRVKKVSGSTTTVYVFSGSKVLAEYENGVLPGSPTREYIYSGDTLLAKIESGATQYYHQDHLSLRLITDSNGTKNGERGHYPFGENWYETGVAAKWKFTSYERDGESLNDYAIFRYHINRLGRFNSPDPIGGSVTDPQSLNLYAYVGNDPINSTDPLGLWCTPDNPACGTVDPTKSGNPYGWLGAIAGGAWFLALPVGHWEERTGYVFGDRTTFDVWVQTGWEFFFFALGTQGPHGPGGQPKPQPPVTPAKKGTGCGATEAVSFIHAHQTDAATVAQQLGVPTENVLGLSGIESKWGTSNAATQANNFFGLHGGANAPFANGVWYTSGGVAMSAFPSYLASGQSFAAQYGSYVALLTSPIQV